MRRGTLWQRWREAFVCGARHAPTPLECRDDRGAWFQLDRPSGDLAPDLGSAAASTPLEAFRSALVASRLSAWLAVWLLAGFAFVAAPAALGGTFGAAWLFGRWTPGLPVKNSPWLMLDFLFGFGAMLGVVAILAIPLERRRRTLTEAYARFLLALRRCPACVAPLDPERGRREPDGCVPCNCGAAWQRERCGASGIPSSTEAVEAWKGLYAQAQGQANRFVRDDAGRRLEVSLSRASAPRSARQRRIRRSISSVRAFDGLLLAVAFLGGPFIPALTMSARLTGWRDTALTCALFAVWIGVWIVAMIRMNRHVRRSRLRARSCPACRRRLRRRESQLHCAACGGVWNRPART
jgi:hypothetical protein